MRARDLMTKHPHVVDERATISEAMGLVAEHGVRHVPVLRDGKPIGVLSDRDLRRVEGLLAADIDNRGTADKLLGGPVSALLEGETITVPDTATAAEVVALMLDSHVGAVLVVDAKGGLAGIISYVDVLRALGSKL